MDTIANFLTSIKNANAVGKTSVVAPFSKMEFSVAELLSKKGFVGGVSKKTKKNGNFIEVELLYENGRPKVNEVKRVSKLSKRIYEKAKNIHSYKQGIGMYVFSTPKGMMADADAKKENIGGELLFKIW